MLSDEIPKSLIPVECKLSIKSLEEKFRQITLHFYDTWISYGDMQKECFPFIHEEVIFKDPWQTVVGIKNYWNAAKGFHSSIFFDFDIHQLNISLNDKKDRGRCIVDGTMNLKQLQLYTYPLRTILVYDFVVVGDGNQFVITFHEEMWSFADMIENLPLGIGKIYNGFRYFMGQVFFVWFFWFSIITYLPFWKGK